MRSISIFCIFFTLLGCQTTKHSRVTAPSVDPIKASLKDTKAAVTAAKGTHSEEVARVKTAIELADELAGLLDQIEKDSKK